MPGKDGTAAATMAVLDRQALDRLLAALGADGRKVYGPMVADDAVVYGEISGTADLPAGIGDEQKGGHYRLRKRGDDALFGYTVAPQSWKRFLFPPRHKLFGARRTASGFEVAPPDAPPQPMAFVGVRACELAAIAIQDRVFGDPAYPDSGYRARRAATLMVAVECAEAGDTCFCASMGSGPAITSGYDIKLVELRDKSRHVFLAEAGTTAGAKLLKKAGGSPVTAQDREATTRQITRCAGSMGREMDNSVATRLKEVPEHGRWTEVATRCLTCGNCTMVCPTCFCSTVEDVTDLKGENAERWRRWDSCFTIDFSYIHGGAIRTETRSRYRQWITHKLSTWHDQFGTSGCVGCGRCITWCPVGIDITEEVGAVSASLKAAGSETPADTKPGKKTTGKGR